MIGLGSQYLTAAGFGRYRITAASLGNLDLLGTFSWLKPATQQAILGAFGDDGMAVIKATNAYLNGIAASDRDKATALAALINEDPMMVCSLGLQPQGVTMPWRWIFTDGDAYVNTGYVATENTVFETRIKGIRHLTTYGGWQGQTDNYPRFATRSEASSILYLTKQNGLVTQTFDNGEHTYKMALDVFEKDGMQGTIGSDSGNNDGQKPMCILIAPRYYNLSNARSELYMAYWKATDVTKANFVPFILGKARTAEQVYPSSKGAQVVGTKGMINLETGLFHPNAGTGQFTIPDISYTPSTP